MKIRIALSVFEVSNMIIDEFYYTKEEHQQKEKIAEKKDP